MEPITSNKADQNALIKALITTDFPGLATADAPVPLASIEKHPWLWFCMSCKTGPHPTSAFKRSRSKIFCSTEYSTHAGHGKIQVFTQLGWPPCVRISEIVAFLGTNFMSDIQSWDYTHTDTSVLFLTPPPPTVPNPDQSHPCQECGILGVRSRRTHSVALNADLQLGFARGRVPILLHEMQKIFKSEIRSPRGSARTWNPKL